MSQLRDINKFKHLLEIFPQRDRIKYCFAYGSAVFEQKLNETISSLGPRPTPGNESSTDIDQSINKKVFTTDQTTHSDNVNNDNNGEFNPNKDIEDANKAINRTKLNRVQMEIMKELGRRSSGTGKKKMIDLVIAVDNPIEFHRSNLLANPYHYSGLRHLGPSAIAKVQQHFGAKIFYNTLIPINGDYIKYGVISRDDLITDLLDWETFYISGRLHKPTLTLERDLTDSELHNALKMNVQSAVHVALLLLPERFQEHQLYLTIAGLSYSGDFRMTFGEDKQKVEKIVGPQMEAFREMYNPLLGSGLFKDIVQWTTKDGVGQFEQNLSQNAVQWHLCLLPKAIQHGLLLEWINENTKTPRQRIAASRMDIDDLMQRLAGDITYRDYVRRSIGRVVFKSSATQTVKGLFTAGLGKSVTYGIEKVNKMVRSMK